MLNTASAHSIEVGPRTESGYRQVTLKNNGRPVFAVTHREVQWTFLVFFHTAGERLLPAASPCGFGDGDAERSRDGACPGRLASPGREPQEYLCVFHREELKDQFGRYVVSQPTTYCSAYAVQDGTETVFALQGISPSTLSPGRVGVFVHGRRQSARWGPPQAPSTIDFEGGTYAAAADVWWMASPLVVKPLYIRQPGKGAEHGPPPQRGPRGFAASPSPGVEPLEAMPPHHTHRGATLLNAQVLFQFCPTGDERTSPTFAIVRTGPEELGLAMTAPVHALDAMALTWLPQRLRIPCLSASAAALTFTLVEHPVFAAQQVVFLADRPRSTVHVLRLSGLPQRDGDGLSHEAGEMRVLFSLQDAGFPLVLACLRPSSPQPIMVCNFPEPCSVTLFSPLRLVEGEHTAVTETGILAQASLAAGPSSSHIVGVAYQDDCRRSIAFVFEPGSSQRNGDGDDKGREDEEGLGRRVGEEVCMRFPSLRGERQVLMPYVLETLEAALGPRRVYSLEEGLICRSWEGMTEGLHPGFDFLSECYQVIEEEVSRACGVEEDALLLPSARRRLDGASQERLLFPLLDPLALTADAVSRFVSKEGSPRADQRRRSVDLHWTLQECALSVVALHLLCEGCRIQVKLCPFADRLARVVCALSARLGWEPYMRLYDAYRLFPESGGDGHGAVGNSFPQLVSPSALRHRFSFVSDGDGDGDGDEEAAAAAAAAAFPLSSPSDSLPILPSFTATGAPAACCTPSPAHREPTGGAAQPPRTATGGAHFLGKTDDDIAATALGRGEPADLYSALARVINASEGGGTVTPAAAAAATTTTPTTKALVDAWPLLKGLPRDHPIAVANDLFRLLCGDAKGMGGTAMEASTGGGASGGEASPPWWYSICTAVASADRWGGCVNRHLVYNELTVGASFPLLCALTAGRRHVDRAPEIDDAFAAAVGRLDRVTHSRALAALADAGRDVVRLAEERAVGREYRSALTEDDGVMMRLDFPQVWRDARLDTAQVFLNTSRPILIPVRSGGEQPADVLQALAMRVCAMPVGRGMLTMSTHNFKVRDSIPIPKLNLDGRTSEGVFVANTAKHLQPDHLVWPLFHNGCAAGLRFLPLGTAAGGGGGAPQEGEATLSSSGSTAAAAAAPEEVNREGVITRHWVVYQTKHAQSHTARAGLLLAAGILGHLKALQLTDIYSLLVSPRVHYNGWEVTTMAVILGLSCSFQGTNNDLVFRCLSMHVQSLTPSAEEIDVSLDVQTCALVSIGVLCRQSPTNTFLVDLFTTEMSRLPSDEHCVNREGYALGAGFGLGLLLLGLGNSHGTLEVEERLFSFLEGARRDAAPLARHSGVETYGERTSDEAGNFLTRSLLLQARNAESVTSCTRVFEGNCHNTAVCGPAAAVALGLMFLKTENTAVAQKLMPPDRLLGLQAVSPLLCLLRTCFAALTCWSTVEASHDFIHKRCVPAVLQSLTTRAGARLHRLAQQQVHYLLMNHGHCIAGAIFAVGLRFAGSMNVAVRDVLQKELKGFLKGYLGATSLRVPTLQRSTGAYEACLSTCCVAVSLVMAGTGDRSTFALFQRVRRRPTASFGSHMALSTSVGLLFLGGGRLSLSTSTESVAALILALYPVWPKEVESNVKHLQILRHLYALAVVPRVIETMDAVSNRPVSVPIAVVLRKRAAGGEEEEGGEGPKKQEMRLETPCLYPPPDTIERIEVRSTRHCRRVVWNDEAAGPNFIGERGLVVRVLENDAFMEEREQYAEGKAPVWEADPALAERQWRNPAERRLLGDVQLLFSRRGLSLLESMVLIDNVRLLAASLRWLGAKHKSSRASPAEKLRDVPGTVSADVCHAVLHTLERRYRGLFVHGPQGTRSGHPLSRVVLHGASWADVVTLAVANPAGTPSFPLDFTTMCVAAAADGTCAKGGGETLDRSEVARWLAEAVRFYFGCSTEFSELSRLVRGAAPQLANPATRTAATLRLNREARLPLLVLQQLVRCCFDDA